jgi:hypothetical protein
MSERAPCDDVLCGPSRNFGDWLYADLAEYGGGIIAFSGKFALESRFFILPVEPCPEGRDQFFEASSTNSTLVRARRVAHHSTAWRMSR